MPLFGSNNPLDAHIDNATSDKNTSEDWAVILDVCDRVNEYPDGPRDFMRAIVKRLAGDNCRVALQAVTLLDACVQNCGESFHLEVASRQFEADLRKILTGGRAHPRVAQRLKECLRRWAVAEFATSPQLALIPALYAKLQREGLDFSAPEEPKRAYCEDPDAVNNKQEEDDIAQAIQLSLQSAGGKASSQASTGSSGGSLYPADLSSSLAGLSLSDASKAPPPRQARALYDFEAAEDNELSFAAGEAVAVADATHPHWWRGATSRGEGLFPANFVTFDLEEPKRERTERRVSFAERLEVTEADDAGTEVEEEAEEPGPAIDSGAMDALLTLLHSADPTGARPDPPHLAPLEARVGAMGGAIDTCLQQVDRTHNELAALNAEMLSALSLYHQLMREPPAPAPLYPPYAPAAPYPAQYPDVAPQPPYMMGQPQPVHPAEQGQSAAVAPSAASVPGDPQNPAFNGPPHPAATSQNGAMPLYYHDAAYPYASPPQYPSSPQHAPQYPPHSAPQHPTQPPHYHQPLL